MSHIGIVLEEKRLAKEAETMLAKVRARELPVDVVVARLRHGGLSLLHVVESPNYPVGALEDVNLAYTTMVVGS